MFDIIALFINIEHRPSYEHLNWRPSRCRYRHPLGSSRTSSEVTPGTGSAGTGSEMTAAATEGAPAVVQQGSLEGLGRLFDGLGDGRRLGDVEGVAPLDLHDPGTRAPGHRALRERR